MFIQQTAPFYKGACLANMDGLSKNSRLQHHRNHAQHEQQRRKPHHRANVLHFASQHFEDNPAPVSYTHLDVYKRQDSARADGAADPPAR